MTNGTRRTLRVPMASCSDCDLYFPVEDLIPKPDSRRICAGCQRRLETATQARKQLEMFCAQTSLFDQLS